MITHCDEEDEHTSSSSSSCHACTCDHCDGLMTSRERALSS